MSLISIISYIALTLTVVYAYLYPAFGDVGNLLDQKSKYEESIQMVSNIEAKKNELLTKFNAISDADKKNVNTVLPSSLDFVRLISQIDAMASNYGIAINSVTSKEVSSSVGGSVANAGPEKPYQSSIIGFSFVASYDKSNAFLKDLEKSLRILDIRSIKLDTKETGPYSYSVNFETYWFK